MSETIRETAERLAKRGEHSRVQAIEEALRARDEARDAEWCNAIWPENPEGAEPFGPVLAGEMIREGARLAVKYAQAEARRQGRESMREEAAIEVESKHFCGDHKLEDCPGSGAFRIRAYATAIRAIPLDPPREEGA